MRYAVSGSVLVHAAIFGTALIGFAWPEAQDAPAAGAVTVDIVTMSSVSANATTTIQSSSTQSLVSSGSQSIPPPVSPVIEAIEPEPVTPVSPVQDATPPEPVEALPPEGVEDVAVDPAQAVPPELAEATQAEPVDSILSTAMLTADPAQTIAPVPAKPVEPTPGSQPVTPTVSEVIAPEAVTDAKVAPVPRTLGFERPSAPTPRRVAPRQTQQPPKQAAVEAAQRPASQAGNGGQNDADAAAAQASAGHSGAGAGGQADVARWQSQVQRRLANALRYPRAAGGERGEVVVRFTVASQGGASGVSIVRSSGSAVLDQAAIETVGRAAPFPPIPANAGFASKTFDFPLGFVRN